VPGFPVTALPVSPHIADYAPTADGEIAVAGPRRTAASGAAFRAYLPWLT
jgi:hypothetical protein